MRFTLLVALAILLLATATLAGRRRAILYVTPGGCGGAPERVLQIPSPEGWITVLELREGDCVSSVPDALWGSRVCCASDPTACASPVQATEPFQCVSTYGL